MTDNKQNYVLFSAIGDSDPVRGGYDGPMLHIVRHWRPQKVYLLLTAEMARRDNETNCYEKAIKYLLPECEVYKKYTGIEKASDFGAYFIQLDEIISQIRDENPAETEILLNISSATPQIKTTMCMAVVSHHVVLHPIQVQNPENKTGKGISHFDPYHDDLYYELANLLDNLADEAPNRCEEPDLMALRKGIVKNRVKAIISGFEYKNAYDLICENASLFTKRLKLLLQHAYFRSLPMEAEARSAAKELRIFSELYPMMSKDGRQALDFCLTAKIRKSKNELSDFVVRIRPLAEFLMTVLLKKSGKAIDTIAVKDEYGGWKFIRGKAAQKYPGLPEYLDSKYRGEFRSNNINLEVMIHFAEFCGVMHSSKEFQILSDVRALRNGAAHDLKTVTIDDIKARNTSADALCAALERIISRIFGVEQDVFYIYEKINNMIEEELDKNPAKIT